MYVVVVDDSDERHSALEHALSDEHVLLHSYSQEEAVGLLKCSFLRIGLIIIDHDLGNEDEVGSGSGVASFILNELDTERFPAQALVVSHNPDGALNIASKLSTAGIPTRVERFSEELVKRLAIELQPQ